jgi:hypothetical protein
MTRKPWWQRTWFVSAYVVALVLAIYAPELAALCGYAELDCTDRKVKVSQSRGDNVCASDGQYFINVATGTTTSTATGTGTGSQTSSESSTASATQTQTGSETETVTCTAVVSWTGTMTATATVSITDTRTMTFTVTATDTETTTDTTSGTGTITLTGTETATDTITWTDTVTASATNTAVGGASCPGGTATITKLVTVTASATSTGTAFGTVTGTSTESASWTWTSTGTETDSCADGSESTLVTTSVMTHTHIATEVSGVLSGTMTYLNTDVTTTESDDSATTWTTVTEMSVSVAAEETYAIDADLYLLASEATGGIFVAVGGTATISNMLLQFQTWDSGTAYLTAGVPYTTTRDTFGEAGYLYVSTSVAHHLLRVAGAFTVDAAGGGTVLFEIRGYVDEGINNRATLKKFSKMSVVRIE